MTTTTGWVASDTFNAYSAPPATQITVWSTHDEGHTWSESTLPPAHTISQPMLRLTFLDSLHGWLVMNTPKDGTGVIFITQDGGATWEQAPLPFAGDITFVTKQVGWLVADWFGAISPGLLAETHDGGHTWRQVKLPVPDFQPGSYTQVDNPLMVFSTKDYLLPVGYGHDQRLYLYSTADGGATWRLAPFFAQTSGGGVNEATSGMTGHLADGATIFRTTDAGQHWAIVQPVIGLTGAPLASWVALHFATPLAGWTLAWNTGCTFSKSGKVCTDARQVFHTGDGGHTWRLMVSYTQPFV